MSKFYATADAIAAHLATVDALAGVPVVVDRQRDILAEMQRAISKQTGGLIVVSWIAAPNEDTTADGPRFASKFSVTLFAKPVIRAGETAADDIAEAIATALHDHRFSNSDSYHSRLVCTGIDPVTSPELLAYRVNFSTSTQF